MADTTNPAPLTGTWLHIDSPRVICGYCERTLHCDDASDCLNHVECEVAAANAAAADAEWERSQAAIVAGSAWLLPVVRYAVELASSTSRAA